MTQRTIIYVTDTDHERLWNLIERSRNGGDRANSTYINRLKEELDQAEPVPSADVPPEVVTMRSKVRLKDLDTGEEMVYSIVFPSEANFDEGKMSILAPMATALLGYSLADTVEFEAPARRRRLRIEEIVYQPESSGNYDL